MTRFYAHIHTATYLAILIVYLAFLYRWPKITGGVTWGLWVIAIIVLLYICNKARKAMED